MFHGYSVVEYINVIDVVNRHFPDVVIPDDMQALALPVLAHRLLPSAEAVVTQQPPERVLAAIVEHLPLPQLR